MPMALVDTRTARTLLTALLFGFGLWFLYAARETLFAFLFAIFFAYLMEPAVSRLEKWFHGRARAIAAIYMLVLLGLMMFFFFVGPRIGHEAAHLQDSLPDLLEKIKSGDLPQQLLQQHGFSSTTQYLLKQFLVSHKDDITQIAQHVGLRAAGVAKEAWIVLLVPLLAIFFLKDGGAFSKVLLSVVQTRPQREFLQGVLADMNHMLAHFIRAQLTLAGLSLVVYLLFLRLMGAPYWLVLGTAGGVMEFIPVAGPLFAAFLILSVSVLMSYPHWALLLIFLATWRIVQDYIVSPRVMGTTMELHPLAAIFGVMAGGELGGILGVYLSIPIMATLRIVWRRGRLYVEKKRFGPLNEYTIATEIHPRR